MGGPIDMERKGCESIGCYIHIVILNCDLTAWPWPLIFKVKFWKRHNSAMGCQIEWNERDVSR